MQSKQFQNVTNHRSLLVRKEAKTHVWGLSEKINPLTCHWLPFNLQAKAPRPCNYKNLNYSAGIDLPLRGRRAMWWPHYSFSQNSWSLTTTGNQCPGKPVFLLCYAVGFFSSPVIIQFSSHKAEVNSLPDCMEVFREFLFYCFRKQPCLKLLEHYSKARIPSHQSREGPILMSLFRMFQLKDHISIPVVTEQPVFPGGKKSWHYVLEKNVPVNVFFTTNNQKLDSATLTQVDWLI